MAQNNKGFLSSTWSKVALGIGLSGVALAAYMWTQKPSEPPEEEYTWNEFTEIVQKQANNDLAEVKGGKTARITSAETQGRTTHFQLKLDDVEEGRGVVVRPPDMHIEYSKFFDETKTGIRSVYREEPRMQISAGGSGEGGGNGGDMPGGIAGTFLTAFIFVGVMMGVGWLVQKFRGSNSNPMGGFTKNKAKLYEGGNVPKVTFDDVAGQDNAKVDVMEVVEFMKDPSRFKALGAKLPKGLLMVGPPGTGKTLMAKAMAGEAKVPFFEISGSDFIEMFVGVGASRVRELFAEARKKQPCIIFIDEIDAAGSARGSGLGSGGGDEKAQTLNQLLTEMDGFDETSNIVVIAATNRPDTLDKALLRPGRFDRRVQVDLPDLKGREQILKVHVDKRPIPLEDDVDLKTVAQGTPGFSGADLEGLLNEAALLSARNNLEKVSARMLDEAKNKILMGDASPNMISDQEKWQVAYHEAGHAILGALNHTDTRVHMISIMGRGRSGGVTVYLPDQESILTSRKDLTNRIKSLYGGRIAEEMIFGKDKVSTGAGNDVQKVTEIARNMVTKSALSKISKAPLDFSEAASGGLFAMDHGFSGYNLSEDLKQKIEEEVESIAAEEYAGAYKDLVEHIDVLHDIAKLLFENETIDGKIVYEKLGVPLPADRPKPEFAPWSEENRAKIAAQIANSNVPAPMSGVA